MAWRTSSPHVPHRGLRPLTTFTPDLSLDLRPPWSLPAAEKFPIAIIYMFGIPFAVNCETGNLPLSAEYFGVDFPNRTFRKPHITRCDWSGSYPASREKIETQRHCHIPPRFHRVGKRLSQSRIAPDHHLIHCRHHQARTDTFHPPDSVVPFQPNLANEVTLSRNWNEHPAM